MGTFGTGLYIAINWFSDLSKVEIFRCVTNVLWICPTNIYGAQLCLLAAH